MYKVVYTKSLDNADEVNANVFENENLDAATKVFNETVKLIMQQAFENEHLRCKVSMHKHKALVKIEDTHHCIALVKD